MRRQLPFLQSLLRQSRAAKRKQLLQFANADQINAIRKVLLNGLKDTNPFNATPTIIAKLRRHKASLLPLRRRGLSVVRRKAYLTRQKGGFWTAMRQL